MSTKLTNLDILSVASTHGISITKVNSTLYRALCPFHNDTKTPNLTLYTHNQSWYCFAGCGGGNAISFLAKLEGISYAAAKLQLCGEQINLDALSEAIDGIWVYDQIVLPTEKINIYVSNIIGKFSLTNQLQTNHWAWLQKFDFAILETLTPQKLRDLTKEALLLFKTDVK